MFVLKYVCIKVYLGRSPGTNEHPTKDKNRFEPTVRKL